MEKRKLKLLEIEQLPQVIETSQILDNPRIDYAFIAKKHTEEKEKILEVTFFSLKTKIAEFRVFFNKNNFITELLMPERKWSSATLDWMCDWRLRTDVVCADERSKQIINNFFGTDGSPRDTIRNFQNKLRKKQLQERHKKETDQIDARMEIIEELPEDFDEWVNEVALNFSRYIYYKRQTKRVIAGYCTSCHGNMELKITKDTPHKNVRHNQSGQCPLCLKAVTFKAIGKTKYHTDEVTAAYMQKSKEGFVVRSFSITKRYREHYKSPELSILELVRDFYEPNSKGKLPVKSFEHAQFKQTSVIRWCKSRGIYGMDIACLYTENLREILKDTEWKYSGIYELAKNVDKFNVYGYLNAYKAHPAYEYLVKLKLYRLVAGNISVMGQNQHNLNLDGNGFQEVLGINREQLNQMQRLNGKYEHLMMIRNTGRIGVTLTDQQNERLIQMGIDSRIFTDLLSFTTAQKIINFIPRHLKAYKILTTNICAKRDIEHIISEDWRDYLENCKSLGYDMKDDFILFPRDLKAAHDEVMKRFKRKKDEAMNQAIQALYKTLESQYGFAHKGLMARPPLSADEIITEGHTLHHCVGSGSYIERMAEGQGYILFIRRTEQPDKPFFTVEMIDGDVVQCRGKNNCGMTEEIKRFIAVWKREKLKSA